MSDKQINQLIKQRAVLKGKLTSFSTYLNLLTRSIDKELQTQIELQLRLDKIESFYDDFDGFQSELEELSDMPEEEAKEREAFESQYYSLVSAGRVLIQGHNKPSLPSLGTSGTVCSETHSHKGKVVEIDLPHFNGEYQHWLSFRDTFNSLIHSDENITKNIMKNQSIKDRRFQSPTKKRSLSV